MFIDGIELAEGSQIKNPALSHGPTFPENPDPGELFFNTSEEIRALCLFDGDAWVILGAVRTVAGKSGDVKLVVDDIQGAINVLSIGEANGVAPLDGNKLVPAINVDAYTKDDADERFVNASEIGTTVAALNEQGKVPDSMINSYNKTEVDSKVSQATTAQYHNSPYDIASAVVNRPAGGAKVLRFVATRQFKIITDCVGSIFRAGVVSTAPVIFLLYKNATQIGTVTFAAGAAIATCKCTETVFGIGDVLGMIAQPVQDPTLADIMFTISAQL